MADLISDGAEFSCPNCPSKLKLTVISSSSTGDSKKLANKSNNFFPPPGGTCAITMGPCAPATTLVDPGQSTVEIDGVTALGAGCKFQCALGGMVTASSHGQSIAKHDEAAGADDGQALEALSLALDLIPFVGSVKSVAEVLTGKDPVTGEETSRLMAAAGIIPGAKVLTKGGKAAKVAKKAMKASGKPGKVVSGTGPMGSKRMQLKNTSYQKTRNSPTEIQGRSYSGHAQDQMQNRGIPPSVVDNTIKTGTPKTYVTPKGTTTNYYDKVNDVTAVVNENGKVVTVGHGKIGR